MGTFKYTYAGKTTVNLPTHGVTATGGDEQTVHTSHEPINHPDFHEVKGEVRKERKPSK